MTDYLSEVHDQAISSCDAIHRERRILLKQEIGRMVLFFTDQPSLLAPNIQVSSFVLTFKYELVCWNSCINCCKLNYHFHMHISATTSD